MKTLLLLTLFLLSLAVVSCFVTTPFYGCLKHETREGGGSKIIMSLSSESNNEENRPNCFFGIDDRRTFLTKTTMTTAAAFLGLPTVVTSISPFPAFADEEGGAAAAAAPEKIVVFGGSGYIGSYVGKMLTDKGYKVVSVARSSPTDQANKIAKNIGSAIPSIEYVSLDASSDDLSFVLKDATAVVSCIGVIGGSNQRAGNGAVNVRIADAAKAAGVSRFVYISVASDLANGPAKFILGDYIKGKTEAEAAVTKDFGPSNSLVVKPAIVAGGPPGEIRPPGPPGVKPASVDSVAKAVVAGAIGAVNGKIDGNDAISAF